MSKLREGGSEVINSNNASSNIESNSSTVQSSFINQLYSTSNETNSNYFKVFRWSITLALFAILCIAICHKPEYYLLAYCLAVYLLILIYKFIYNANEEISKEAEQKLKEGNCVKNIDKGEELGTLLTANSGEIQIWKRSTLSLFISVILTSFKLPTAITQYQLPLAYLILLTLTYPLSSSNSQNVKSNIFAKHLAVINNLVVVTLLGTFAWFTFVLVVNFGVLTDFFINYLST